MKEEYIYAVARVRCKETGLLSGNDIESLVSGKDTEECIKFLFDKGWGDGTQSGTEALISYENEKMWSFIHEIVSDMSEFDILLLPLDYNNIKAAVKSAGHKDKPDNVFINGTVAYDDIIRAVDEKDYSKLPEDMAFALKEAYTAFIQTEDGQLSDAVLDKACLSAIIKSGRESGNELLKNYSELVTAVANIKIAVRSCRMKKTFTFIRNSLVPCETIDISRLAAAANGSISDLFAYLSVTPYADAAEKLKESNTAFERWCDDRIMSLIKKEKLNPFTIGPIFAYVLARQNEMNMVRIILSAKQNDLDEDAIRKRMREMYV